VALQRMPEPVADVIKNDAEKAADIDENQRISAH